MFDCCPCLLLSNLVDGPNVNVAFAKCWVSRINYYFSSLVIRYPATQYATYIAVPFLH